MIHSNWYKTRNFFSLLWKTLLDGFFPVRCLRCGKYDQWVCADCHGSLPLLVEQHCPLCTKHVTDSGDVCVSCQYTYHPPYDRVFIASCYKDPLLRKMIHFFKYRFIKDMSKPLALLLAQALQNSHMSSPDILIPVPLHRRRYRWRGFNQVEELARELDLQIPIETAILKRVRYTRPQVTMRNRDLRVKNMHDAFVIQDPSRVRSRRILLIDDVMTTGATVTACATALKKAGAQKVDVLVLARE